MPTTQEPIWITGVGVCTPLGFDFETMADSLFQGRTSVKKIDIFPTESQSTNFASFLSLIPKPDCISQDRFLQCSKPEQLTLYCMEKVLASAGLTGDFAGKKIGIAMGIGPDWLHAWERDFYAGGQAINQVGREARPGWAFAKELLGLQGPSLQMSAACASGNQTLIFGAYWLRMGLADYCIVGSCAINVTPLTLATFGNLRALSRKNHAPAKASRPFDVKRDGFVLGEGGALLLLERKSTAQARGAKPFAEFLGGGNTSDAHHMVIPSPDAGFAELAIRKALAKAKVNPNEIDYINAHGTSTPVGDISEAKAIQNAFGDFAMKIPVSSTKSMTGHLLAAASAIEAVVCLAALAKQAIPPTINLEEPDPKCNLCHVANEAKEMKVNKVLSNSFGFGGSNSCVVFSKPH